MFYVTILGSGSAGNCALIESATARVLLDGGLSAKQMRERLALCGVNPVGIDAILLTHEHSDHAGGVEVWCKQFGTPVYANGLTAEALRRASKETKADWRVFTTGADFEIKDIAVQNFSVPHDAMDPVGFMLHHGGESLGFLTDLGRRTRCSSKRITTRNCSSSTRAARGRRSSASCRATAISQMPPPATSSRKCSAEISAAPCSDT